MVFLTICKVWNSCICARMATGHFEKGVLIAIGHISSCKVEKSSTKCCFECVKKSSINGV